MSYIIVDRRGFAVLQYLPLTQIVTAIMFVTIGYVVCIAQRCLLLSCYKHDASFLSDLAQDASRIVLNCQSLCLCVVAPWLFQVPSKLLSLCSSLVIVLCTMDDPVFV